MTLLSTYQKRVDSLINENMLLIGPKSPLRDACEYALTNGGKRFRPMLALMMSQAVGKGADVSLAALAIEYFHTASLVADDMPSMDDDDERRNKPSVHKIYGEGVALLVTYALISAGYECLAKISQTSGSQSVVAIENAAFNTGLCGATGGQFLDIDPPDLSEKTVRKIIHKKTVSLFEISFVSGWLYGGGDFSKLDLVKRAASNFGMAFQIADDLGDMEQDITNGRAINMANIFGKQKAEKMFHVELSQFRQTIQDLVEYPDEFLALSEHLAGQY